MLQGIVDTYVGLELGAQQREVQDLKRRYRHRITVDQVADPADARTCVFNCHAYAFGLHDCDDFWRLRDVGCQKWPDGDFVRDWLFPSLQAVRRDDANDEDIVLYVSGRQIKHSGKVVGRLIRSKWGTGHVWRHNVWEIPICFGFNVGYYRRPALDDVVRAFLEFAQAA